MSPTDLLIIADHLVKLRSHCQGAGIVMNGVGLVDFAVYELPQIATNFAPLLRKYDGPAPAQRAVSQTGQD